MKIYQVGGAVRDRLRGSEAKDTDYVVVGATVCQMEAEGFVSVGKNFPVFLHPETKEEYALARKEIKTGDKHGDFEFIFTPDTTLEEDLKRRDFTCNAIAYDGKEYIDPFGGQKDIQNKILRHIDDIHFMEDPLRILRLARFCAQLDFEPFPKTLEICREMVAEKMLKNLSAERIWAETLKALETQHFEKFILNLKQTGALEEIMPEVAVLFDVPENEKFHPEKNTGGHVISALRYVKAENPLVKFGVLMHDLGKGATLQEMWPKHKMHDYLAKPLIQNLCQRLKVPKIYENFALMCAKLHMRFYHICEMHAGKIVDFIDELNVGHKNFVRDFIEVCKADMLSTSFEDVEQERRRFNLNAEILRFAVDTLATIKAQDMPQFKQLEKNAKFGKKFRAYKANVFAEKLHAFKKEKSPL